MKLLVSHHSALRYWRGVTDLVFERAVPTWIRSANRSVSSAKDIRQLHPADHGIDMSDGRPLDVLVGSDGERRFSKEVQPHVWKGRIPKGSLLEVAEGIYVSSPEFTYLQLAGSMDLIDLAKLANELCGIYNLDPNGRMVERSRPLTSVTKLRRFLTHASGSFGAAKGLKALRWVCNGSASPRETNTLLALCLPTRMGGYGLPLPVLNPEIPVGDRLRSYVDGDVYRPDFMWVRTRGGKRICVTAEYDSHEYHDGEEDAEHTRIRRNDFKTMGMLTNSINRSQLNDGGKFLLVARQIARDLGIYRKEPTMSEVFACDELLHRLNNSR